MGLELPARGLHHCLTREGFVFHPCPVSLRIMSRDFRSLSMLTAPHVPDFKQNSVPPVATSLRGSLSVLLLFVFSIFRQIPWPVMVSRDGLGWLLTSWVLSTTILAQPYDCPLGWTSFEDHCYHFVFYPTQTYHAATATCEQDGAYLLSVNSEAEHTFISQRLTRTELDR
ncbi:uncharacterized protein LOC112557027 [Pomacea canaliculata]|uniref:uncharacterized protein LOC112557027 n=1 Tax=Pomacea canaliculata TaxID=400727 RepID=UPI000D72F029|nr:uncharacterized protein LOC112557027 [Pomacea canaliculata]